MRRIVTLLFLLIWVLFLFTASGQSCSSFAVFGQEAIYGSNLDWFPPDQARFSIHRSGRDIKYFTLEYRMEGNYRKTMGMNCQGLMASLQTVPPLNNYSIGQRGVYISEVFQWALANSRDINEIKGYLKGKEVFAVPGFSLHLHLADRWGGAMVIEIEEDGLVVVETSRDFSLMTNFYNSRYLPGEITCPRYLLLEEIILAEGETFSVQDAWKALWETRQATTRISLVFLPERRKILMAWNGDFSLSWEIDLEKEILIATGENEGKQIFSLDSRGLNTSDLGIVFDDLISSGQTYFMEKGKAEAFLGKFCYSPGGVAEVFYEKGMLHLNLPNIPPVLLIPKEGKIFSLDMMFAQIEFWEGVGEFQGFTLFHTSGSKEVPRKTD